MFINDLGEKDKVSTIHLYADNTNLYTAVPSVAQVVQKLYFDFCAIQKTLIDLKLLLNSDKTKCMQLSKKLINSSSEVNITTLSWTPMATKPMKRTSV